MIERALHTYKKEQSRKEQAYTSNLMGLALNANKAKKKQYHHNKFTR
jgi:hypothetical protein